MASTIKISNTADWARTFPSLTSVLGAAVAGMGGNAIPIRIANKVLQEILQRPFGFKWNRVVPAPFLLNGLQQDYSTSITNLGWVENATRTSLFDNNTPHFVRGVEVVRELLVTDVQATTSQLSWVFNSEAICGTWAPNTRFINPNGLQALPNNPLTQIRDSNGNVQVLTTFGTTGTGAEPTWAEVANAPTNDGSCVWTMADPNGITWRVSPCPPQNGIVWSIQPYYQMKPTTIALASQFWGIPDEMSNVFEAGFIAFAWQAAEEDEKYDKNLLIFKAQLQEAVGGADREAESFSFYPSRSITGRGGSYDPGNGNVPPGMFGEC